MNVHITKIRWLYKKEFNNTNPGKQWEYQTFKVEEDYIKFKKELDKKDSNGSGKYAGRKTLLPNELDRIASFAGEKIKHKDDWDYNIRQNT